MTENLDDRIDLCKDLIFRAIFGDESAVYILKCLLNSIMTQAELPLVESLELKNPFNLSAYYDSKYTIMDIHAVDKTGRHFDIEMQVQRQDFFDDRLFYYGTEIYATSLEEGQGYSSLPRVICIAFINYPISEQRPDVWFDVWQMHSTLGTGLGTDKMTSIFVRLPRVSDTDLSLTDKFSGELAGWVRILSSYPRLTDREKLELIGSTEGFAELERRIEHFFSTKEGREVLSAQRKFDAWLVDYQNRQDSRFEEEHKARCEAEREREEAEREREEERREREEAERRALESQKKGVLRLFKNKFGANAELPENWAEGRTYDELETLADKIYECVDLQEALDLFR